MLALGCFGIIEKRKKSEVFVLPREVSIITAGIDVQKEGLKVEIVAYSPDLQSWGMGYHELYGSPGLQEVWEKLIDLLDYPYPHAAGSELKVRVAAIDVGYSAAAVSQYLVSQKKYGWVGVRGRGDVLQSSKEYNKLIIKKEGGRYADHIFQINSSFGKDLIASWSSLRKNAEKGGVFEAGHMHFISGNPGYDSKYFNGLGSEKKVPKASKNGQMKLVWQKTTDYNHPLDARVYSLAAVQIAKQFMGIDISEPVTYDTKETLVIANEFVKALEKSASEHFSI